MRSTGDMANLYVEMASRQALLKYQRSTKKQLVAEAIRRADATKAIHNVVIKSNDQVDFGYAPCC